MPGWLLDSCGLDGWSIFEGGCACGTVSVRYRDLQGGEVRRASTSYVSFPGDGEVRYVNLSLVECCGCGGVFENTRVEHRGIRIRLRYIL